MTRVLHAPIVLGIFPVLVMLTCIGETLHPADVVPVFLVLAPPVYLFIRWKLRSVLRRDVERALELPLVVDDDGIEGFQDGKIIRIQWEEISSIEAREFPQGIFFRIVARKSQFKLRELRIGGALDTMAVMQEILRRHPAVPNLNWRKTSALAERNLTGYVFSVVVFAAYILSFWTHGTDWRLAPCVLMFVFMIVCVAINTYFPRAPVPLDRIEGHVPEPPYVPERA